MVKIDQVLQNSFQSVQAGVQRWPFFSAESSANCLGLIQSLSLGPCRAAACLWPYLTEMAQRMEESAWIVPWMPSVWTRFSGMQQERRFGAHSYAQSLLEFSSSHACWFGCCPWALPWPWVG